jgi:hypothetical protein
MSVPDLPTESELAIDPELALLHALGVTLRLTARMLQATLPEFGDLSVHPPLASILVARRIASRALELARWIDAYPRARRRENAAVTSSLP